MSGPRLASVAGLQNNSRILETGLPAWIHNWSGSRQPMNRRSFLFNSLAAGAISRFSRAGGVWIPDRLRPVASCGVQAGDVTGGRAVIWSRSDQPARMIVEYSTSGSFSNAIRVVGPAALENTDFTARLDLSGLPPGQRISYRVQFQSLANPGALSEPVTGTFRTPPSDNRDVSLVWGGDVCGQGWGINPEFGGMKIFEAMRRFKPDFLIHSGDTIYADGIILPEVLLDDGTVWRNLVTPEKSRVAETQQEFWGNHRYNLLDENFRRFNQEVPIFAQWDDHETRNNWYPGQILEDPKYSVKSVDLLSARARRAFLDYLPLRFNPRDPEQIYRHCNYGPHLDVFMLDERSYRAANGGNRQANRSPGTEFLGNSQITWLKRGLLTSRATWKVIASDMPIANVVRDGVNFESFANGDGPALGRELELADLLKFIKRHRIRNIVWLTADVHYAAAHYYNPEKAQFKDFLPFWEFVAGPFNAGTFGPGVLDNTFGPEVKFTGIPPGMKGNRSPKDGYQFFGGIRIDGKSGTMAVSLQNIEGRELYKVEFSPSRNLVIR